MINRVQSTPLLPPISSRYPGLLLPEFELSPIIRQLNPDKHPVISHGHESQENTYRISEIHKNGESVESQDISNTYSNTGVSEATRIELSTWIGGNYQLLLPILTRIIENYTTGKNTTGIRETC